jgi:tRNA(Ile)-lysidine synthase
MNPLESKFEKFVRRHQLADPKQSVLLGVSGGVDSMVMLHLFSRLQKRMELNLSVVHVNHQLRHDESMGDEQFVREMSIVYGIPFYCEQVDVISKAKEYGLSKQIAARQLRYECFERIRQLARAHSVATAHHADDNAETILLNILRGTGIHGLAGIPIKREIGNIIRPLLFSTRKEIEMYASENNIKYRNDSSNASLVYHRNLLRHRLLPPLVKRHPNIIGTLNSIAEMMRDVDADLHILIEKKLDMLVKRDAQNRLTLYGKQLTREPHFLQNEIFVALLRRLDVEPTEKKVEALHTLCMQPTGRSVELNGEISAWKDRTNVIFKRTREQQPEVMHVEFGRRYNYQGCSISLSFPAPVPVKYSATNEVEYVDADRLGRQLVLRPWHAGDWFIPLGMKTKKKLSNFFTDQKIPRSEKSSIPVLESNGVIVWICGKRLDNRFKLTEQTKTVIRLTYQSSV